MEAVAMPGNIDFPQDQPQLYLFVFWSMEVAAGP